MLREALMHRSDRLLRARDSRAQSAQTRPLLVSTALLLGLSSAACQPTTPTPPDAGPEPTGAVCTFDDAEGPNSAIALTAGEARTGQVCPVEDEDWFALTVPDGHHLVDVKLAMDGPLSPIEPTYAIWSKADDGSPAEVVAGPPADEVGGDLALLHCLAPGSYLVSVRDQGDDAQDFRRSYALEATTRPNPDTAEPNDTPETAVALTAGTAVQGTIACRGDVDAYSIEAGANTLLRVQLSSDVARYEPQVRVLSADGAVIMSEANAAGTVQATAIDRYVVLPGAGRYSVMVSDNDGRHADADVAYSLTVLTVDDQDPNEPNNRAVEATALSQTAVTCGATFSPWMEVVGTVGAPGDPDWYRIPLSGCDRGILEAEMVFDTAGLSDTQAWDVSDSVQAALAVVRGHAGSACGADSDCRQLQKACRNDWECAGYSNTCLPEGLCAGAVSCLEEAVCGATMVQRNYAAPNRPGTITEPPPANVARVAVPLEGAQSMYIRAGDYQANGANADVPYRLRVRVRAETDVHEPDNVYVRDLYRETGTGVHRPLATTVPVHDCAPVQVDAGMGPDGGFIDAGPPPEPDCCTGGDWIEGSIGYENDSDWYRYQHPCPGEDCMVRVVYELDEGPVDFLVNVYRGNPLWFDGVFPVSEESMHAATSGAYGGLDMDDTCFYAYQRHSGDPFYYFLEMRDLAQVADWDSSQNYRFCVEKIENGCFEPCTTFDDNGTLLCDTP